MQTICSKKISGVDGFQVLHHRNAFAKTFECFIAMLNNSYFISIANVYTAHSSTRIYRLLCVRVCSCDEHHLKVWTFSVCCEVWVPTFGVLETKTLSATKFSTGDYYNFVHHVFNVFYLHYYYYKNDCNDGIGFMLPNKYSTYQFICFKS